MKDRVWQVIDWLRTLYSEDQQRDDHGKFGPGGNSSDRAQRARDSHKPVTAAKIAQAKANEHEVAQHVGGKGTDDNAPHDVITGRHAIEVKTIIKGEKDKITMHGKSLARKLKDAVKNGYTSHTVVYDDRHGGHQGYYRKGLGSFRLKGMTKFKNGAHLSRLVKGK